LKINSCEQTGNYYYGARYYDPKISVWLSVDPLASEAAHLTPYHFVSNSPLNRIDPDGRKDLIFDSNGDYTGEIQNNNFFHNLFFGARGIVQDGNGNVLAKFTFNDQNYVDRFENLNPGEEGYLSGINRFNKYDLFMEAVVSNPVKDIKDKNLNDFELLKEIYSESALSLDFYDSGELLLGIPNDRLSVIDGVAYDSYDAGNYAWGVSMRKLGIRYLTAAAGSQFNGFWNGKYDNSQWTYGVDPYLDRITWTGDSRADQKAIRKGFFRK
jgi:RHS repeat-associated protein